MKQGHSPIFVKIGLQSYEEMSPDLHWDMHCDFWDKQRYRRAPPLKERTECFEDSMFL